MRKVKAHSTLQDIGTLISEVDRKGNDAADEAAKEAVKTHPCNEDEARKFQATHQRVERRAEWICKLSTIKEVRDTEAKNTVAKKNVIGVTRTQARRGAHECIWDRSQEVFRCGQCLALRFPVDNRISAPMSYLTFGNQIYIYIIYIYIYI